MNKRKVIGNPRTVPIWGLTCYDTTLSDIGLSKPSNHPARFESTVITLNKVCNIQRGDILRCDGLPFASKPQGFIWVDNWGAIDKAVRSADRLHFFVKGIYWGSDANLETKLTKYSPVKVADGLWVLRNLNEKN